MYSTGADMLNVIQPRNLNHERRMFDKLIDMAKLSDINLIHTLWQAVNEISMRSADIFADGCQFVSIDEYIIWRSIRNRHVENVRWKQ